MGEDRDKITQWYLERMAHIEPLAKRLHSKMEHLDPCFGDEWDALSEVDKDFFRECIEFVVLHGELLEPFCVVLGDASDRDVVGRPIHVNPEANVPEKANNMHD